MVGTEQGIQIGRLSSHDVYEQHSVFFVELHIFFFAFRVLPYGYHRKYFWSFAQ